MFWIGLVALLLLYVVVDQINEKNERKRKLKDIADDIPKYKEPVWNRKKKTMLNQTILVFYTGSDQWYEDKKEFGLWWVFILILFIVSIMALTTLGYFGKLTGTFIERKVFEQSYQRSEGLRSQMNAWQAQLASINSQLVTETDPTILKQLKSQKAMLEMQIAETKGMK